MKKIEQQEDDDEDSGYWGRIGADEIRHTAHTKAKNHNKIKFNRKIQIAVIVSFFYRGTSADNRERGL